MQLVAMSSNNEAVTTTLAIADGTENDHASVIKLVRTYANDIEEFGILDFKSENQTGSAGRPTEYAVLNEDQATLLMTYMRNSDIVRNFKKRLVKEFRNMHNALTQRPQVPQSFSQALLLAAKLQEEVEQQAIQIQYQSNKIAEDQPKVQTYDELIQDETLIKIDTAAKMCGIKPSEFRKWFRYSIAKFCRQDEGSFGVPNQDSIDKGYLVARWKQYGYHSSCTAFFLTKGVEAAKRRLNRLKEVDPNLFSNMFPLTTKGAQP